MWASASAVDRVDELIPAYNQLGWLHLWSRSSKVGRAELAFRKALELSGGKSNILRENLAEILWRRGREKDALTLLDGLVPPDEETWKNLWTVVKFRSEIRRQ